MKFKNFPSPNFNEKKRSKSSIKFLVIHYTGMQSERESIARLCDLRSKVSCHYLISVDGKIYRLVNDQYAAWHAGISRWGKYKNLNKSSIGIELVNKGHRLGYTSFKKKQLSSLIKVCKILIKKYKIKKKNVVGHSDIAPLRKNDPGEKFPWKHLAYKKIGIWHSLKPDYLKKFRKIKIEKSKDIKNFFNDLSKIGYFTKFKNKLFLKKTIKAFQRHYRKELINGAMDKECLLIANNLSKKL